MSRVLPAAAAAALILAACGSDDPETADDEPIGTVEPGATDPMTAPSPIEIIRGSGSGNASLGAESASADATTSGAAPSDMMIAPVPWVTEFVVDESMPALPADAVGYVYDNTVTVSAQQVEQLAASLGVPGDAVRVDDGYQVSWRVGPDDGSAPSVWVYEDAQLSWNYNSSWGEGIARSTCAVSVDADGTQTEECDEPEPPVGVPSEADAEARVRELLVGLGENPDALDFETFGDEWFTSVSVSAPLDAGQDVRYWNFGFGAEGVMQHAGGTLATPAPVGPYPLVDLDTAVARLGDAWFGGGVGGGMSVDIAVAEPAIAVAESPPVDIAEGDVGVDPDDEMMPVEPMPEPEPVTVTLVDVEADLWWAWDIDGSVWLLPAYRFVDADGNWYTAPAVTDEFMIQVEPPIGLPEPMPVEPAPEPMPAPEPVEPDPDPGQDPGTPPSDSTPPDEGVVEAPEPLELEPVADEPEAVVVELNDLLPLKLEEFIPEAELFGFSTRVVVLDGEALAVTMDFRGDRVNVEVKGDNVVAVQSVG